MTELRDEFEQWAADWRAGSEEPLPDIRTLRRRARRQIWVGAANFAGGAALVAWAGWFAWTDPRPTTFTAAVAILVFTIAALIFEIRARRGAWKAKGDTTLDYLDLVERQLSAQLRGIRFAWGLVAAEVAFFCGWLPWVLSEKPQATVAEYVETFGSLVALVAVFSMALVWLQRRTRRKLERLTASREGFERLDRAA